MGPQPGVDRHARRKLLLVLPISRQAGARGAQSGKMVDPALQRWLGRRDFEGLLLRAGREPCRLISSVVDFIVCGGPASSLSPGLVFRETTLLGSSSRKHIDSYQASAPTQLFAQRRLKKFKTQENLSLYRIRTLAINLNFNNARFLERKMELRSLLLSRGPKDILARYVLAL